MSSEQKFNLAIDNLIASIRAATGDSVFIFISVGPDGGSGSLSNVPIAQRIDLLETYLDKLRAGVDESAFNRTHQ